MNRFEIAEMGRDRVTADLQKVGFTVARAPRGSRWHHLIAQTSPPGTVSRPIHVQTATESSFRVWRVWAETPSLLLAYVWYVADPAQTETYALTYLEAKEITRQMGWQSTKSWQVDGGYGTTKAAQHGVLSRLLAPYRMTPEAWRTKVTRIPR